MIIFFTKISLLVSISYIFNIIDNLEMKFKKSSISRAKILKIKHESQKMYEEALKYAYFDQRSNEISSHSPSDKSLIKNTPNDDCISNHMPSDDHSFKNVNYLTSGNNENITLDKNETSNF